MRRYPRLICLLLAFVAAFSFQSAWGATLAWEKQNDREQLVFTFKGAPPKSTPRQRGLTEIEIFTPRNFWDQEPIPKKTDFSGSTFVRGVEFTPDGIFVVARTDAFEISWSTPPQSRKLILEFRPYVKNPPVDTPAKMPQNASEQEVPAEPASTAPSLRGKVSPPDQSAPQGGNRLRMPVDRAATAPGLSPAAEPATQEQAPEKTAHAPVSIEPVVVLPNLSHAKPLPKKEDRALKKKTIESKAPDVASVKNETASASVQSTDSKSSGSGKTKKESPQEVNASLLAQDKSSPVGESNASAPSENASIITVGANNTDAPSANASVTNTSNATDNATAELEALFAQAQLALSSGKLEAGKAAVEEMLRHPGAPEALREDLLYTLADIAMQQGRDDLHANFWTILQAYETAKNTNVHSRNIPEALAYMGYLHLAVGNEPEAKGYFDLLRRKYPDDARVPMTDYYWGEHYLKRGEFSKAAEHFQYVVQNYPYSNAVTASTFGLLKAFMELGFFDKAMELVRAVEKRWPRYYLSDPSFLMTAGHAAMATGQQDLAREYLWAYVNIVPQAPDVDMAMARIGDILMQQGRQDAARELYHRTAEGYPDREGGLIAQMRLAEEGVLDHPSVADMDPVFGRSGVNPESVYNRILENPDGPLAPVARLKLAMWRLWEKKYAQALEEADRFQRVYPDHDLLPRAREVADKALQDWIADDLAQGNFDAVLKVWNDHAKIFKDRELPPQMRLALATALAQAGDTVKALNMAGPIVFSLPQGEYSEPGMDLVLSTLVDERQWADVIKLAERVKPWALDSARQRQVDYAAALAQENLLRPDRARPLWEKLGTDMNLPDTQRGYALYFLARDALDTGKLQRSAVLAQDALNLFLKDKSDMAKIKDCLELLGMVADRDSRFRDALAWSLEADEYVSETDRDWSAHTYRKALRFRKNGNMEKWKENLEAIIQAEADSLYGRMAKAELKSLKLEQEVERFH